MRKLAILAALTFATLTTAPKAAEASRCGQHCLPWLEPIAWGFGAGLLAGYGYSIYYYADKDLEGGPRSTNYYGSELIVHGAMGSVFAGAMFDAGRNGDNGTLLTLGAFSALHFTLAGNGMRGLWSHRDEFHPNETLITWTVGSAYGINTLYWASQWPDRTSRTKGLVEVATNAPFLVGFGKLAADRYESQRGGSGFLYGGLAAVSGVFVAHGVVTMVAPRRAPRLDLLGTDLAPTVVSDGRNMGAGLGTQGSW